MTKTYPRPLPRFYSSGSRDFYDGCKQGQLLIQRCRTCGKWRFPPQFMCSSCHSTDSEWAPVSGRGVVSTFTVIPGFEQRAVPMSRWPADGYPISVIVVELADAGGAHLVSNIVECAPSDIRVGMEVEVVFEEVTEEITLPRFRPLVAEISG